jgi:hypothetical protein
MQLNNILANLFNISVDCIYIHNNIKFNNHEMAYLSLSFLLQYSEGSVQNIKTLRDKGYDIYEDEDMVRFLYTDINRKLIKELFGLKEFDLIEISGINIDTEFGSELFIDEINFNYKDPNISIEISNIKELFDFEKMGLSIQKIDINHIRFEVININRRIKDIGIYKKYKIDLIETEREMEILNNDISRHNIIDIITHYLPNYNIDILEYNIKNSRLNNDFMCIDGFLIKYKKIA